MLERDQDLFENLEFNWIFNSWFASFWGFSFFFFFLLKPFDKIIKVVCCMNQIPWQVMDKDLKLVNRIQGRWELGTNFGIRT